MISWSPPRSSLATRDEAVGVFRQGGGEGGVEIDAGAVGEAEQGEEGVGEFAVPARRRRERGAVVLAPFQDLLGEFPDLRDEIEQARLDRSVEIVRRDEAPDAR